MGRDTSTCHCKETVEAVDAQTTDALPLPYTPSLLSIFLPSTVYVNKHVRLPSTAAVKLHQLHSFTVKLSSHPSRLLQH